VRRKDRLVPRRVTERAVQEILLVVALVIIYIGVVIRKKNVMDMDQSACRKPWYDLAEQEWEVTAYSAYVTGAQGETLTLRATVKDHKEYQGERQTTLQRVKEIDPK
jgi:hypothetical protein